MNAKTTTEKNNNSEKQDYRRNQFGGSFGGPIVKDKVHYFGAVERTQQDTFQVVNTKGLFPTLDGIYATPYRETLFNVKVTANLTANQYLSVRYGRNQNSQPYGAADNRAPSDWGDSDERVQLDQPEPQLGARRQQAERVHLPVRRLPQRHHRATAPIRYQLFPNGVAVGQSPNTPQTHAAEEVAVPRRLLLARHRHGRRRPRHQGRRQLHQRAAPLHHLQLAARACRSTRYLTDNVNGPISHGHPQRRRRVGQHPAQAVRVLRPGRLGA